MSKFGKDEFYVGYRPASPPGIATRTRAFVIVATLLAVLTSGLVAIGFHELPLATFEFGNTRTFEGTFVAAPYPALWVERPGASADQVATSRYSIVAQFKWGAGPTMLGFDGKRVQLDGTLVHRDGQSMIELVPGSVRELAGVALTIGTPVPLGEQALVGEIVDSKCFLGVMNPGNLKPHRACAIRCISGGIPPVFCVRDRDGRAEYLLLVGEAGEALNAEVLEFVALPMEIRGNVERIGDQLVLRTSPQKFTVL